MKLFSIFPAEYMMQYGMSFLVVFIIYLFLLNQLENIEIKLNA